MSQIPLGKREDLRLELKGRDALKAPENIAREVVAMLNAAGGDVWIGLRDEGGRAVAVEPIPDIEMERRRLRDSLVDSIEPNLAGEELRIEAVEAEQGGSILRIILKPVPSHRPYAFLKKGGRHFVTRLGDRISLMTREEIGRLFKDLGSEQANAVQSATDRILGTRKAMQEKRKELFWLCFEPAARVEIDIQSRDLAELFQEPSLSGNRRSGWNFAQLEDRPSFRGSTLAGDPDAPQYIEVRRNGGLLFQASLETMSWKGEEKELWPLILLEYPISAFRIARHIYQERLRPGDEVVVDLALFGVRGWKLRSGSPGSYPALRPRVFSEADDFLLEKPFLFREEEIETEPDRCGYRLVERVYEAFGYRREAIPRELDRESGRLVLPE